MSYTLTINTIEQDLAEPPISLESLKVSWSGPRTFRFIEHAAHVDASFEVEDDVLLSVDETVRFRGRIKRVDLEGVPNAERVVYICLGLRELAKDVTVHDPTYNFPRVVFNAPLNDDDYDAARSDETAGEIIAWLFDQHADHLRAAGVIAASPATGYVAAELDALDVVPPKVVLDSQDFDAALDELIAFQSGYRFIADPDTQTFHFEEVATLATKTITYNSSDKPLSAILKPSTEGRATAVKIYGPRQPINRTVKLSGTDLTKHWDTNLESTWTWAKCFDPNNADTYGRVFRRFQITDSSKRRFTHALASPAALDDFPTSFAPHAYRKTTIDSWARVPAEFDFDNGIFTLAQPATTGDQYTEGNAVCASDICFVYAYLSSPLTARAPTSGYAGTAYTEPQNPVEVLRRFYDEHFTLTSQTTHYAKMAAELLRAYEDIVYAGVVRLRVLDWAVADLDQRLNFTGRDDEGGPITTGFESLGAMLNTVLYDFTHGRTELDLSTDASTFVDLRPPRVRELETQARRNERYRALYRNVHAPTPRAGNDGEIGAIDYNRGVYSLRRHQDATFYRIAGHVDIESGDGINITRQVDATHNGIKITAKQAGEWYWFYSPAVLNTSSTTTELRPCGCTNTADKFYPEMAAGTVTKVRAVLFSSTGGISAGGMFIHSRKGAQADTRAGGDVDAWTNSAALDMLAIGVSSKNALVAVVAETTLADGDALGAYVVTDSSFSHSGSTFGVMVGLWIELA